MAIPAQSLPIGQKLENGWIVIEKLTKSNTSTGGKFSAGYKVEKNGKFAFLKAFDFSSALNSSNQLEALKIQLDCYLFEKELLEYCKGQHLNKIVLPIDSGKITINGFTPVFGDVYYIIFDIAQGDIRKIYSFDKVDFPFIFSSLHNIAVGINELHSKNIAHQDIKPSNALVFDDYTKISDIGRASALHKPFIYDSYPCAGDRNYMAPEQKYGYHTNNDFSDRFAADMFCFGSLFFFYFFNMSLSSLFETYFMMHGVVLTNDFNNDLPFWIRIFDMILYQTNEKLKDYMKEESANMIIRMIKELCYPDPHYRGHHKNVKQGFSQYDFQRFISELDILANKAKGKML